MSKKKWTNEALYEEAKKYKTKIEFAKGNGSAYQTARRRGLLVKYVWFENGYSLNNKKRTIWTYEKCKEVALKCKTVKELYKQFPGAYSASNRNRWIDNFDWLERKENIREISIDNVYAYLFKELNSVYIGRSIEPNTRNEKHRSDKRSTVYKFAHENNILIPEMIILESCLSLEEGLEKEDYYVNKYREEGWNVLNKGKTGKRSGSIGAIRNGKWNQKTCYEEAKKYKSSFEFSRKCSRAYNLSRKNKWLDDYTWFLNRKKNGYWTEETCYEEALKYDTVKDFRAISSTAYCISLKKGWYKQYTWLQRKRA